MSLNALAIVAEMRDFAAHRDYDSDGNMSTTALRVFADRIEEVVTCYTTLADDVRAMRDAQKAYFRTRTGDALKEAKRLEAEVDRALKPAKDERQEEMPL